MWCTPRVKRHDADSLSVISKNNNCSVVCGVVYMLPSGRLHHRTILRGQTLGGLGAWGSKNAHVANCHFWLLTALSPFYEERGYEQIIRYFFWIYKRRKGRGKIYRRNDTRSKHNNKGRQKYTTHTFDTGRYRCRKECTKHWNHRPKRSKNHRRDNGSHEPSKE